MRSGPRATARAVLLVCEEAHRYLPRVPTEATRSVEGQLERIAREGRKYGVCLGLVTQRPSELSETALSQCGTIMSLRLNNQSDQAHLVAALTEGARSIAGTVGALRNRECIVSGEGVPIPMRVLIDTLDEARARHPTTPLQRKLVARRGRRRDAGRDGPALADGAVTAARAAFPVGRVTFVTVSWSRASGRRNAAAGEASGRARSRTSSTPATRGGPAMFATFA